MARVASRYRRYCGGRPRPLRLCLVLLLAVVLPTALPDAADAHARLETSDPPSGSALLAMPGQFTLTFNEPVDVRLSRADLYDREGALIQELEVRQDDDEGLRLSASWPGEPSPQPGTYLLVWRVLSTVDGHVTTGTVSFSMGTGESPRSYVSTSAGRPAALAVLARWLELSGWLLICGVLIFRLTQWRRLASLGNVLRNHWYRLALAGLFGIAAGLALGLWSQVDSLAARMNLP